jgi:hypothetical protein
MATAWEVEVTSTPMFILSKKLKRIKNALKVFNNKFFDKISERVLMIKRAIKDAQYKLQENVLDLDTHRSEPMLFQEYLRLAQAEESFLRQKSLIQWLNLGDKNSKFFFNLVKSHQCHNKILSIHDDNGTCLFDAKEIQHIIVNYFEKLLGGTRSNACIDILRRALPRRLSTL